MPPKFVCHIAHRIFHWVHPLLQDKINEVYQQLNLYKK